MSKKKSPADENEEGEARSPLLVESAHEILDPLPSEKQYFACVFETTCDV